MNGAMEATMITTTCSETCECGHPLVDHNDDGCMYPDPASMELVFCPCSAPLAVNAEVA